MSRLSKIFNFENFTPHSRDFQMLRCDTNPIRIRYAVTELWAIYRRWKQYKTKAFELFCCHLSQIQYWRHPTWSLSQICRWQLEIVILTLLLLPATTNIPLMLLNSGRSVHSCCPQGAHWWVPSAALTPSLECIAWCPQSHSVLFWKWNKTEIMMTGIWLIFWEWSDHLKLNWWICVWWKK